MSSPRGWFILAPIYAPSRDGERVPDVSSFAITSLSDDERSTIGSYWNAVDKFLNNNDATDLDYWQGTYVGGYELVTDYDDLYELEYQGELTPDEIYEMPA